METNQANEVWKQLIQQCLAEPDYTVSPRGMEVQELLPGCYEVPMPAYLDLTSRKVNVPFMFAEAAWILSGSNRLEDITPYMAGYAKFSDDGVLMRGAYGPKVTDQLGYVVDAIVADNDTRQAVINIWRERPGPSKDIPCTVSMQFLLREGALNVVTTMRSEDIVLGLTYDVFTFSMIARAVQLLLKARGLDCRLGKLFVNAGSLHIYERHYEQAGNEWACAEERDMRVSKAVAKVFASPTYPSLVKGLREQADRYDEAA